jgi:surface-anchored protein
LQDPAPSGTPDLGLATEELVPGDWSRISWSLGVTSMPAGGNFSLWRLDSNDPFGGAIEPLFSTADPAATANNNAFFKDPGSHAHYNYAFTAAGLYEIEFITSGTHNTDGFKSDSATFLFAVGDVTAVPEPGSLLLLGSGAIGLVAGIRRRARGQALKAMAAL